MADPGPHLVRQEPVHETRGEAISPTHTIEDLHLSVIGGFEPFPLWRGSEGVPVWLWGQGSGLEAWAWHPPPCEGIAGVQGRTLHHKSADQSFTVTLLPLRSVLATACVKCACGVHTQGWQDG